MTREEKTELLNRLLEIEEKNDIGNLTRAERREFQQWVNDVFEQEPKTGHWITKIKSDLRGDMWSTNPRCSECGGEPYYSNTIYNYKYCPYCGVKMLSADSEKE